MMREVVRSTLRSPRWPRPGLLVWGVVALLAAALVVPSAALGEQKQQQKKYSFETDPIRLGMKALEEARLSDAKVNFDQALNDDYQAYKAHYGLAEIMRRQAQYDDAEALYRLALTEQQMEKKASPIPEANAGLGLVLLRLGRLPEAKQQFDTALKGKKNLWLAQYGTARVLIAEGDYNKALKLIDKGSRLEGILKGEDLYRFGMALVLYGKGDLPNAEKYALQAFNLNPNEPEFGTLVAEIYTKRGAPTLAIDAYEMALAMPGARPTGATLHSLGLLYEHEKQYNDALDKYKESARADSTYAPAWKSMGALYALAKRNDEAASAYLRYAQLEGRDPEGLLGLAEACLKTNRFKQALEAAETAYGLDSENTDIRLAYARSLFQDGQVFRAAELYGTVTDSLAFTSEDYLRLGRIQMDADSLAVAERLLTKAIAEDSTSAEAHYYLGLVDLRTSRDDSAMVQFEKASALDPENPTIRLNQGITLLRLKKSMEAIHALREAVRLAPGAAQPYSFLAQAYLLADSTAAAVVEYTKAREIEPDNPGILRGLGLCYLKNQKDYGLAVSVLQRATEVDPGNADGWAWYGQSLALQKRLPESVRALKKALAINPNHGPAKRLLDIIEKGQAQSAGTTQS